MPTHVHKYVPSKFMIERFPSRKEALFSLCIEKDTHVQLENYSTPIPADAREYNL